MYKMLTPNVKSNNRTVTDYIYTYIYIYIYIFYILHINTEIQI
jgi:hypothetical protein